MTRGTTPVYTITIDGVDDLSVYKLYITIRQNAKLVTYTSEDTDAVQIDGTTLTLALSQADTLTFRQGVADLQVRAVDAEGVAWASDIAEIEINPILKDGVIEYGA